jgi:hypothetical protein
LTSPSSDDRSAAPIPFARPSIGPEEEAGVLAVLRSGWLTTGPVTARFEEAFARTVGLPHALALNSATAGLHLGLEALGVGPGAALMVGDNPRDDGGAARLGVRTLILPRTEGALHGLDAVLRLVGP